MPPVQKTFTLVPQAPRAPYAPTDGSPAAASTRLMTSKQVQKAYKAANRAPRLSRAERIKQERLEQERIRKEFEKEKTAARARELREKKKDKQLAEREAKRKKGLPTVKPRPSQDMLTNFFRGNGTARKRDAEGQSVEAVEAADTPEPETEAEAQPARRADAIEEDDFNVSFEEDLALEMLEGIEAARGLSPVKEDDDDQLEEAGNDAPGILKPANANAQGSRRKFEEDLGLFKRPRLDPADTKPTPAEASRHSPVLQPPATPHQAPPMSTQAILCNFDEYFPSPSQQARELEEEPAEDLELEKDPNTKTPPQQPCAADTVTPAEAEAPRPSPSLPAPRLSSPSLPPRRFFTSSGSHEIMCLALHRSRRTAKLEEIQHRERYWPEPDRNETPKQTKKGTTIEKPAKKEAKPAPIPPAESKILEKYKVNANKKNVSPSRPPAHAPPSASQESEYGGDWVDEAALELMI